ncbi:XcbB/CpsF family capsular polysaccharide biosynthesis protein [Aeromonas veronii]
MSSSVINIDCAIEAHELDMLLSSKKINYIHVSHKHIGGADKNIIELSRNSKQIKELLIKLTNHGFMTYVLRDGVSSLVHHDAINNLWFPVKNKEYSISSGNVIYTYEDADFSINKHLVVMFYPVAPNPNSSSLNRYFPSNFTSLKNYLSKNISILRIADVGGVSGAFYMNTKYLINNEENIQSLIEEISDKNGIARENIILYGASKGGTGALYHSLLGGYSSLCVDPILDDEHYLSSMNDLHNINGIFPITKKDKFADILLPENINGFTTIITSPQSEQYKYIMPLLDVVRDRVQILNNINPNILKHPDVAPNSIHAILAILNMFSFGVRSISEERVIM